MMKDEIRFFSFSIFNIADSFFPFVLGLLLLVKAKQPP
jgi:lipoprotein signal peptidase